MYMHAKECTHIYIYIHMCICVFACGCSSMLHLNVQLRSQFGQHQFQVVNLRLAEASSAMPQRSQVNTVLLDVSALWRKHCRTAEANTNVDSISLTPGKVKLVLLDLGFKGGSTRSKAAMDEHSFLLISEGKLTEWARTQNIEFPSREGSRVGRKSADGDFNFSLRHVMLYLWHFYSGFLAEVAQAAGGVRVQRLQKLVLVDIELCARILTSDLQQRGLEVHQCSVDDIKHTVEENLTAATGFQVDSAFMCELLPVICAIPSVTLNTLVAFGILMGSLPAVAVGPVLMPKIHHWMALLLELPLPHDAENINMHALIQEHLLLVRENELRKRGRLEVGLFKKTFNPY